MGPKAELEGNNLANTMFDQDWNFQRAWETKAFREYNFAGA